MPRLLLCLVLMFGLTAVRASADDEPLPSPRVLPSAPTAPVSPYPTVILAPRFGSVTPLHYPPPFVYRVSAYQVWQYYGVNQMGYLRPRVLDMGYGRMYYLATGQPYPWTYTHLPSQYRPFAARGD